MSQTVIQNFSFRHHLYHCIIYTSFNYHAHHLKQLSNSVWWLCNLSFLKVSLAYTSIMYIFAYHRLMYYNQEIATRWVSRRPSRPHLDNAINKLLHTLCKYGYTFKCRRDETVWWIYSHTFVFYMKMFVFMTVFHYLQVCAFFEYDSSHCNKYGLLFMRQTLSALLIKMLLGIKYGLWWQSNVFCENIVF